MTTPSGEFPWEAANATDGLAWYAGQGIGDWKLRMAENVFKSFLSIGLFALRVPFTDDIADAVIGPDAELEGEIPSLAQVSGFLQGKWDLMDDISGVVGGIVDVFTAILKAFGGDFSGIADLPAALLKRIEELALKIAGLFGLDGLIRPWLLPAIGIGQLTGNTQNLAADGGFDTIPIPSEDAITGPGQWFRDPAVGSAKLGAACIEGDGQEHDLLGTPLPVVEDQKITYKAKVNWGSPVWSADPARLVVIEFEGETEVARHVLAATTLDGTPWKQMTAEYTAPAGVDVVVLALTVTADLTGGKVWFDDVSASKPGLIEQGWVQDLTAFWERLLSGFGITGLDGLPGLDLLANAWKNLVSLLSISNLSELLTNPGSFDGSAIIERFIEFVLWPFNMLGKIVGGKLLDAQAPQSMLDIIDRIWNGWANLGDMLDFDRPGGDVLDSITGILGVGLKAQTGVASAEARLRALESAGNAITDDFQRSSSSSLGGAWSAFSSAGAGSGSVGTDGSGNAVWKPSGTGNRTLVYRNSSSVTTDSAVVRAVLASSPPQTWPDDAYSYVCLSVASSEVSYVRLRIGGADLVLQAVVTGTVTNLGTVSQACKAGDTIEIQRGLTGGTSLHSYSVRVNGVEVLAVTDGGSTAKSGSGFRGLGIGMETSARATIWPPFLTQWQPAGFAIVSLSEVL